eukprot:2920235-Rhodomonas_salina.3
MRPGPSSAGYSDAQPCASSYPTWCQTDNTAVSDPSSCVATGHSDSTTRGVALHTQGTAVKRDTYGSSAPYVRPLNQTVSLSKIRERFRQTSTWHSSRNYNLARASATTCSQTEYLAIPIFVPTTVNSYAPVAAPFPFATVLTVATS